MKMFNFWKMKERVKALEEENIRLRDENDSLWHMLDEISASEIANYSEMLQDMILEKQQNALMTNSKRVDA
mgnify:CR=1 FL=1